MQQINKAVECVRQGGVIVYPTESVYGLGCDPFNRLACEKIMALKQRENKAGFICLLSSLQHLNSLISPIRVIEYNKIKSSELDHVSWILPAKADLPDWLKTSDNTICVRYSQHQVVKQLCDLLGQSIISTSANLQGQKSVETIEQAKKVFGQKVDYYLDMPVGSNSSVSTIRELCGRIIR